MSVLSRLFKQRKPLSVEQQVAALKDLSDTELLAVAEDTDRQEAIRCAAIEGLDYSQALSNLAFSSIKPALSQRAKKRIAALIDSQKLSVKTFALDCSDPALQLTILGFCVDQKCVEEVLNNATDKDFLYAQVLEGASVKLRMLAAQNISDAGQLATLQKLTKGSDKAVYKIVRDKCALLRERERQAAEIQVAIDDVCELMEQHGARDFDKMFTARTQQLKNRWASLSDHALDSAAERYRTAGEKCRQTIDAELQKLRDVNEKNAGIATSKEVLDAVLRDLKSMLLSLFEFTNPELDTELNAELESGFETEWLGKKRNDLAILEDRWLQSESQLIELQSSLSADDKRLYTEFSTAIKLQLEIFASYGGLDKHLSSLRLLTEQAAETVDGSAKHEIMTQLKIRLNASRLVYGDKNSESISAIYRESQKFLAFLEQQQKDKKNSENKRLAQLGALIKKSHGAVDRGQSRQAVGIRKSISEKLTTGLPISKYLAGQLEQLDEKLDKLQDWKDYAVAPRVQQLIDAMRSLVDASENPEALAVKIKRLQDEWKTLSRGGGDNDSSQWEMFHDLAQKAYQPCKEYFADEAKIREQNFLKRKAMVEELGRYIDGLNWGSNDLERNSSEEDSVAEKADLSYLEATVDCRDVEKLLAAAQKEWHSYSPSERAATKPLKLSFESQLAIIRAKLNAEYEKNIEARRGLIAQAEQLMTAEDSRRAVEEIKRLQVSWKNAAVVPRKVDQTLWKKFRAACDAVFELRQQQSRQFKDALNANRDLISALTIEVQKLSELEGQTLLDARARIAEIRIEYAAVGSLPKESSKLVLQLFDRAIAQFEAGMSRQQHSAREQAWSNLLAASNTLRLYQLAQLEGDANSLQQSAVELIEKSSVEDCWPKNSTQVLEQKMAATNIASDDLIDNEKQLRLLCIRAEIISDKSTLPEDRSLRMNYQVEKLQQGLGQKVLDVRSELNTLLLEWVAVGPVATQLYEILVARFIRCRQPG